MKNDNQVVFNFKLPRDRREKLKQTTRERGLTMQSVLSAFVESYIQNPDSFKVKMEVEQAVLQT